MANENKLFRTNSFKVVGTLAGAEVKTGVAKNGGYVSVDAVITAVIDGVNNEYQVGFFANETTKDGKHSKLYDTYVGLPELINKKVEITGEIRENRYWSTNLGQMVSTQLLSGRWVKGVPATTADEGTYEIGGFIGRQVTERKNKNDEVYRYDVTLGQSNFNGDGMSIFTLHVNPVDREILNGVESYEIGETVKLKGKLAFTVETKTEADPNSGFGEPMMRTFTNKQRNFYIIGGSNPGAITGESAYDASVVKILKEAYDKRDVELQASAKTEAPSAPVVNEAPVTRRQTSLL